MSGLEKREVRRFLSLWVLAVAAATAAFSTWLSLRVRSVELGYQLGRSHARVARLREIQRVLELEIAAHQTPERVELVARSLLGMSEPSADRIFSAGELPEVAAEEETVGVLLPSGAPPEDDPMLVDESAAPRFPRPSVSGPGALAPAVTAPAPVALRAAPPPVVAEPEPEVPVPAPPPELAGDEGEGAP